MRRGDSSVGQAPEVWKIPSMFEAFKLTGTSQGLKRAGECAVFFKMSTKIFYLDGNHVNSLAFFKVQHIFFSDPVSLLQPFLSDRSGG